VLRPKRETAGYARDSGPRVLGLDVVPGPVVADFKYLTRKHIGLPLSRARTAPKTQEQPGAQLSTKTHDAVSPIRYALARSAGRRCATEYTTRRTEGHAGGKLARRHRPGIRRATPASCQLLRGHCAGGSVWKKRRCCDHERGSFAGARSYAEDARIGDQLTRIYYGDRHRGWADQHSSGDHCCEPRGADDCRLEESTVPLGL
jgi:hypothetical protein